MQSRLGHKVFDDVNKKAADKDRVMRARWVMTWKSIGKAKTRLRVLRFQDPDLTEVPRDSPTLSAQAEAAGCWGRLNILGLGAGAFGTPSSLLIGAMLVASVWPRSCRALWLLPGRGQVVLGGFCLADVRSCSLRSAWPSSWRRRRFLQLLVDRARCLQGAVVLQVPGRVFQRVLRLSVFVLQRVLSWFLSRAFRSLAQSSVSLRQEWFVSHIACVNVVSYPSCAVHTWRTGGCRCLVFCSCFRLCFGCLFPSGFCLVQRAFCSCVVALDDSVFHV